MRNRLGRQKVLVNGLHNRSEGLLPQHANVTSRIHADETERSTTRVCRIVRPHQESGRRRWRVHQNAKVNVRSPTGRHTGPTAIRALNEHGYHQSPLTPGLWKHKTQPISFTICVDDFRLSQIAGCAACAASLEE